jgi:hypothetical protein
LHEVVAGLLPGLTPATTQETERVERVSIVRIEKRLPTPTPSPSPTPAATPHAVAVARAVAPVLTPVPLPQGKSARVEPVKHLGAARPKPPRVHESKPIWDVPTGAQGAGAQKGAGAGSLASTNGAGSGTGAQGNGEGGGGAPCGAVDFSVVGPAHYDPATGYYERNNVVAIVHFADGTAQRVALDWTWRYKTEADDPFNPAYDAPMFFQFPPAGKRASEPALVQYIMKYSTGFGTTKLNADCPNIPPAPSRNGEPVTPTPTP